MKSISRLHYITTNASLAEQACRGGIDWIQLRLKGAGHHEFLQVAGEVQSVCNQYNATLIINDNVGIAKEIGADGVHLGKEDMAPEEARQLLGDDFIIGSTANSRFEIIKLSKKPINYVGLGPFRFTPTKKKLSPVIGLQGYSRIMESLRDFSITEVPVLGIGGITENDIENILSTGIYGVAVSGAISNAEDVVAAAGNFKSLINVHSKN